MVFLDRRRRAGHYLRWKVALFSVGAVLALAGMYLQERWLTGAAIAVLVLGMLVRFLPEAGEGPDEEGDEED